MVAFTVTMTLETLKQRHADYNAVYLTQAQELKNAEANVARLQLNQQAQSGAVQVLTNLIQEEQDRLNREAAMQSAEKAVSVAIEEPEEVAK
jgi:hypothetical protein